MQTPDLVKDEKTGKFTFSDLSPTPAGAGTGTGAGTEVAGSESLLSLLRGAVNPDIIVGFINGDIITNLPTAVLRTPDYKIVRFATRDRRVVEIRYAETQFSAMRKIQLIQDIRARQEMAQERLDAGSPRFVVEVRSNPYKSHTVKDRATSHNTRTRDPPLTISELEKWSLKRK